MKVKAKEQVVNVKAKVNAHTRNTMEKAQHAGVQKNIQTCGQKARKQFHHYFTTKMKWDVRPSEAHSETHNVKQWGRHHVPLSPM